MFRRIKIWNVQRKHKKKMKSLVKPFKDIYDEMNRAKWEYLQKEREEDKNAGFYKGRYEGLRWIFNERRKD